MAYDVVIIYYIRCLFPWRSCSTKTMKTILNPQYWCVFVVGWNVVKSKLLCRSGLSVPPKTQSRDYS